MNAPGGFGGWTKTFTDPRLCAAIVDRLTFGGNIIETGTDSYRLAHTRAQALRTADRQTTLPAGARDWSNNPRSAQTERFTAQRPAAEAEPGRGRVLRRATGRHVL
jgi:hypothetical protein